MFRDILVALIYVMYFLISNDLSLLDNVDLNAGLDYRLKEIVSFELHYSLKSQKKLRKSKKRASTVKITL